MTAVRVSPAWLALREPADAAARAPDLVTELCLPARRPVVVHDLACGTGSMMRWLAPRLPGPQHWVCYDLDAELLTAAAKDDGHRAADGSPVTVSVRHRDVTRLPPGDCAGATLITASAVLDLLTVDDLARLVATCVAAGCPVLLTLSVTGRVELWPPHPLDGVIGAAFNAHQRRITKGRRLLGPDAARAAVHAFRSAGFDVATRATPWLLGSESAALAATWFAGWLGAASEQRPELTMNAGGYGSWRLGNAADGRLRVRVGHLDLLARPMAAGAAP